MNQEVRPPDPQFDRQLDRLVDGELNADERRRLLAECDERPDAWRRCALAFLEAQAWRSELTSIATPVASTAIQHPTNVAPAIRTPSGTRRRWVRARSSGEQGRAKWSSAPWALAASALIAFALGWLARTEAITNQWIADPDFQSSAPQIAQRTTEERAIATADDSVDLPDALPEFTPTAPETITLVMDCGPDGEQRQIELPVMPAQSDDLDSLEPDAPVVSAELQAALLRMGHRVQQQRQYMPFVLDDGRRVVVPVDKVEFLPVEAPAYQ